MRPFSFSLLVSISALASIALFHFFLFIYFHFLGIALEKHQELESFGRGFFIFLLGSIIEHAYYFAFVP
jgi:hypothetical protein